MDAGSSQPANGGREGMVLQQVLLVTVSVSPQPPRAQKVPPNTICSRTQGADPRQELHWILHAPPCSCPTWLIGADTSLGSVCVASSQLTSVLLNHFASTVIQTLALDKRVLFYAAPVSM